MFCFSLRFHFSYIFLLHFLLVNRDIWILYNRGESISQTNTFFWYNKYMNFVSHKTLHFGHEIEGFLYLIGHLWLFISLIFRSAINMKDVLIDLNVELSTKDIVHTTILISLNVKYLKQIFKISRSNICIRVFYCHTSHFPHRI